MSKNYVDPMVVDANGNIYISMQEYKKDIAKAQEKLKEYRDYLKSINKGMKKLAKNCQNEKEKLKAKGYINALTFIIKDLKEMVKLGELEEDENGNN